MVGIKKREVSEAGETGLPNKDWPNTCRALCDRSCGGFRTNGLGSSEDLSGV